MAHTMRELDVAAAAMRAAGEHPDVTPLLNAARDAAAAVRAVATRSREPVRIRVVETSRGVRVTVLGPRAGKYKALMEHALDERYPAAADMIRAEIRSQIRRA